MAIQRIIATHGSDFGIYCRHLASVLSGTDASHDYGGRERSVLTDDTRNALTCSLRMFDEKPFGITGSAMARLGATVHICRTLLGAGPLKVDYFDPYRQWTHKSLATDVVVMSPSSARRLAKDGKLTPDDLVLMSLSDGPIGGSYGSSWTLQPHQKMSMALDFLESDCRVIWLGITPFPKYHESYESVQLESFAAGLVIKATSTVEEAERISRDQRDQEMREENKKWLTAGEVFRRCYRELVETSSCIDLSPDLRRRFRVISDEISRVRADYGKYQSTDFRSWGTPHSAVPRHEIETLNAQMEPLLIEAQTGLQASEEIRQTFMALVEQLQSINQIAARSVSDYGLLYRLQNLAHDERIANRHYLTAEELLEWMESAWSVLTYAENSLTGSEYGYLQHLIGQALGL